MKKTKEKNNIMKKVLLMLCAAVLLITTALGSSVTDVQAASKKEKAKTMRKFKNIMENVSYRSDMPSWAYSYLDTADGESFCVYDINNDKKMELIVTGMEGSSASYTVIYSSEGKLIGEFDGDVTGVAKNAVKVYNATDLGGEDGTIYKVTKKKIVPIASWCRMFSGENQGMTYYLGEYKKTTKSKYKKAINKYKFKKVVYHMGTQKNIDKYLK